MIFNLEGFIKDNLMSGFDNGSFTEQQVNIFSFNYFMKGHISQETFDELVEYIQENSP